MISVMLNGQQRELPAGTTIGGVLDLLGIKREQAAVEQNGEVVPRRLHGEAVVGAGDVLEVVTFVGGG